MKQKLLRVAGQTGQIIMTWLNVNPFRIILILSLFHIGLAAMQARGSGRADSLTKYSLVSQLLAGLRT
jgi:hypothetical protein